MGKKRSTVTNYLRLLKLDPIIQTGMRDGFLSMGHGRALINVENSDEQLHIYEQIIKHKLSVRQTEELVKGTKSENNKTKKDSQSKTPSFIKEGIPVISDYFGHKINVSVNAKGKGKITIPFHSEEDFNRIKKLLE